MHQNEIYKHNPKLIGMQDEEASPHPPPERGTTALWEAKRKESAPTHNSAPPVPCRGQPPTHPPPASATVRCGEDSAAT